MLTKRSIDGWKPCHDISCSYLVYFTRLKIISLYHKIKFLTNLAKKALGHIEGGNKKKLEPAIFSFPTTIFTNCKQTPLFKEHISSHLHILWFKWKILYCLATKSSSTDKLVFQSCRWQTKCDLYYRIHHCIVVKPFVLFHNVLLSLFTVGCEKQNCSIKC